MMEKGKPLHYKASNELDFYTDDKNIPNQDLVIETIEYFRNGQGSRLFEPLEALNLIWQQYEYVLENWSEPDTVLNHLRSIPISETEKHVLLGFILKWFGGYPIMERNETNPIIGTTKKAIEKEFLSYAGNTPEKEYCKADSTNRHNFMKLGIALTTTMNHKIPLTEVLDGMGGLDWNKRVKQYYNFDTLFKDVSDSGEIGQFSDENDFIIQRSRYEYDFKVWLQEKKSWEDGNDEQYRTFLTKDSFLEFIEFQNYDFPKKEEVWQLDDLYQHYLKTKRFVLQAFLKAYDKDYYDEACKKLQDYQYTYEYIYCKLNEIKRVEFKHDTIDHLNNVKEVQTASKFVILLDNIIDHFIRFDGLKDSIIFERSIMIAKIADKETANNLRIKEGDRYYIIPEAKNWDELFERFEKLNCQSVCESFQKAFKQKHGAGNRKVIEDELREINDFIARANKLNTVETFKLQDQSNEAVYSRLMHGYYQNQKVQNYFVHSFFEAPAILVYAKYVLYKKWLEMNLMQYKTLVHDINSNERFTPTQKAGIVISMIGDNDWKTKSPVYHHIKGVLKKHGINSKEAREIMLDMQGMNSPETNTHIVEPIIKYLERIDFTPNQSEPLINDVKLKNDHPISKLITDNHPEHDPNLWNKDCYELFKYLFENYYQPKSKPRQLTNIWFYLKEHYPSKYILLATKDDYKSFIHANYPEVKITNFDKAVYKYPTKDKPSMDEHRQHYEDSLK